MVSATRFGQLLRKFFAGLNNLFEQRIVGAPPQTGNVYSSDRCMAIHESFHVIYILQGGIGVLFGLDTVGF